MRNTTFVGDISSEKITHIQCTTTYTKTQPTDSEYWDYTVSCTFLLYVYLLVRMNSNVIA